MVMVSEALQAWQHIGYKSEQAESQELQESRHVEYMFVSGQVA